MGFLVHSGLATEPPGAPEHLTEREVQAAGALTAAPKVKAVTSWIMTSPDHLEGADKASLNAILAAPGELAAVTPSVRRFAAMMNERRGRTLLEP
jgi:3-mercaptopyruvate sulfurtransferase SseA